MTSKERIIKELKGKFITVHVSLKNEGYMPYDIPILFSNIELKDDGYDFQYINKRIITYPRYRFYSDELKGYVKVAVHDDKIKCSANSALSLKEISTLKRKNKIQEFLSEGV